MSDLKLTPWGERGFARAMTLRAGGIPSGDYPTQDKHTAEDEADYIQGFNLGMKVDTDTGMAYMQERELK